MASNLPTAAELDEFRTAIALARAQYNGQKTEFRLLAQLITHPEEHVYALRALVNVLLLELDGAKRDANEVLSFMAENAAVADARP